MPELRFDPLGRRHVLLAAERAGRGAPAYEPFTPDPAPCDFCAGREDRTPPETFAVRPSGSAADSPGWSVRVVPNLYPATTVHEVVVHTPDHFVHFEEQKSADQVHVLRTYQRRVEAASQPAAVVVWNRGRAAGASRTHAHGQLFGLDLVPPTLEREANAFTDDSCVLCMMADDAALVVAEIREWRIVAHPVPLVADELLVVPPCTPRFETLDEDSLSVAAEVIALTLSRTTAVHGEGVPFNLVFHTAPAGPDRFHWHAHLMPRTAVWGGLEMGAELPIVAADPYETARRLRA